MVIIDYINIGLCALIAITLHELSHGYVSYKLGDPTAKNAGRLTLNPIKHIDMFGLLALVIFKFGWAKPVPIDPRYYKNRKQGIIMVSIAGPLMNLCLACICAFFCKMLYYSHSSVLFDFFAIGMQINVGMFVFNLLPFPPLDGSKILFSLLPDKVEYFFYKYEKYFMIIVLVLVLTDLINYILYPPINLLLNMFVNYISY